MLNEKLIEDLEKKSQLTTASRDQLSLTKQLEMLLRSKNEGKYM